MQNKIYVLYDKLAQQYLNVSTFATDAVAVYEMQKMFEKTPEAQERFELCRCGAIDIQTGVVTSENPVRLNVPNIGASPVPIAELEKHI